MDLELVNKIKRLAIIALASDDLLVETLVLKGGNAIDIAYHDHSKGVGYRTSYDLDFSIENGDFKDQNMISDRIEKTLNQTFLENNYILIDYKFINKPKTINDNIADFWGGYRVTFKIIQKEKYDKYEINISKQRMAAIPIKPDNSPTFELEFSKFEFIGEKAETHVDGFKIYLYTPEMICFEKLRAICQQLPLYKDVIQTHSSRGRARDFYDICLIMDKENIVADSEENKQMLMHVFSAKKVPISFIKLIKENKSIHKEDWENVKATVSANEVLKEFDFYFDKVVNNFENITYP